MKRWILNPARNLRESPAAARKTSAAKLVSLFLLATVLGICWIPPASGKQFTVLDRPLNVFGFASQSAQFSLKGDDYHVEEDLQQALFTLFAEADYRPRTDLIFYVSGLLTTDWVYEIKHNDSTWRAKKFNESRDELFIDTRDWQTLKECHITWTPGDFLFRVGKQIISWGEMDFFRIMDQINPIDDRRGFSDVEFETTIIPIYLVRAEWWPMLNLGWLEEAGLQFVFNPNAMFIPNQRLNTGNSYGGIWSAGAEIDNQVMLLLGLDPSAIPLLERLGLGTRTWYVGAPDENAVVEPEQWDEEGFEYGVRLSLMIKGTILTLNGFYGRENSPQLLLDGFVANPTLSAIAGMEVPALGTASDGKSIVFPRYKGFYPRQQYVGVTWTGDLPFSIAALGGVNPLVRVEALYQFRKVYTDADQTRYIKSDLLDTGLGIDWKMKIPFLNPRAYFSVMPQFLYSRIMDYPLGVTLNDVDDNLLPDNDYYTVTLAVNTSFINGKLIPQVAGAYLFNNEAHLLLASLSYQQSNHWQYTLEAAFLGGEKPNVPLWLFRKNDYIAIKVKYNWG